MDSTHSPAVRARDLGVPFDGTPGPHNAITDIPGVEVGMVTIIDPDEATRKACTGVTAILPRGRDGVGDPCAAGIYSLNGNGEMTGRSWIEESGALSLPIAITNSHAVGAVHTGVDQWVAQTHPQVGVQWMLPTVAETWDGYLNDINGGHVRPEHAHQALDAATGGPVPEGCVGGGTGMNCYGFKGGTGTASRVVMHGGTDYTVGVLMQANFGVRKELTLHGVKLGEQSAAPQPMATSGWFADEMAAAGVRRGAGSVIVIVGTDAPLIPTQCEALARRVALGLARTGTPGGHFSGDIFLAFSTGNSGSLVSKLPLEEAGPDDYDTMRLIPWGYIDPFYEAVVQATEEAVMNALVAAVDTVGRDGHVSYALPHEEIRAAFGGH